MNGNDQLNFIPPYALSFRAWGYRSNLFLYLYCDLSLCSSQRRRNSCHVEEDVLCSDPLSLLTSEGNSFLNYVKDTVHKWNKTTDYVVAIISSYTNANLKWTAYLLWFHFLFEVLLALQYILLTLPVLQHICGQFLHVLVVALKVVSLRLFSDVCYRKLSHVDMLSQGQICLHKLLAAEERVKSTPLVIWRKIPQQSHRKLGSEGLAPLFKSCQAL